MRDRAPEAERIVVGVSRSPASRHAVLWAAQEAHIRRSVLLVTHVDPPSEYAPDLHDAATACHRLLADSATVASEAQPGVAVGTLLLTGSISDELIRLSQSAELIVVGVDHGVSRAAHGAIGSIEDRVAVHAHCPVVTVSAAAREDDEHGYVTVGWTDDRSGAQALAAAAAEAAVRGASLTVVLAPSPNGEVPRIPQPEGPPTDGLRRALADVARQHPTLTVSVDGPGSDWLETLIDHSAHGGLLVIGSHHSNDRWSVRVGATAGAVLRQASGPVMLIGGSATTPAESSLTRRPPQPEQKFA
jgi:nucleotide-binding universal stress UspA family protein